MKFYLSIIILGLCSMIKASTAFSFYSANFLTQTMRTSISSLPSHNNPCELDLFNILNSGEKRLLKNTDEIDEIIIQIERLTQNDTCSPLWKAVSNLYAAQLIWTKYQMNSYRYDNYTSLVDTIPADMNQWSSNIYFSKVIDYIDQALRLSNEFKDVKATELNLFLDENENLDNISVYTAIRIQAIDILKELSNNPRLATTYVQHIQKSAILLANINEFINYKVTGGKYDVTALIIQIYQQLLKDSSALFGEEKSMNINLERLQFCKRLPIEDSEQLYIKQLESLFAKNKSNKSAVIIASLLFEEKADKWNLTTETDNSEKQYQQKKETLSTLNQLLSEFPNVPGSCKLENIRASIESGETSIQVNHIQYQHQPIKIRIQHTNCASIQLSIKSKQKIVWNKTFPLSDSQNLIQQNKELEIPGLDFGQYTIITRSYPINNKRKDTYKPATQLKKVYIDSAKFVVSNLSAMSKEINNGEIEIRVTDRNSGKPVSEATIKCYKNDYRQRNKTLIGSYKTDVNGLAIINKATNSNCNIKFEYGNDKYLDDYNIYLHRYTNDYPDRARTNIFTDRSVYRPGQTVYYKAILYNCSANNNKAISDAPIEVSLYNAQGKIVATQKMNTDRFGSVNGEFIIPKNGMNGTYRITTPLASENIIVAEYKRPSFQLAINNPTNIYAFGDDIHVTGNVKSYSGFALSNTDIQYTISLEQYYFRRNNNTKVTNGNVHTDSNGNFDIVFKVDKPKEAGFVNCQIQIKATDEAGEVQEESTRIPLSENPLLLNFKISEVENNIIRTSAKADLYIDKTKPHTVTFSATNLCGIQQNVKSSFSIWHYVNASDMPDIKPDTTIQLIKKFDTDSKDTLSITTNNWKTGKYLLRMSSTDSQGRISTMEKTMILYDLKDKKPPYSMPYWLVCESNSCEPNGNTYFYFGTSYKDAYILYQQITTKGIIKTQPYKLSNQVIKMNVPFKEEYGHSYLSSFIFWKNDNGYAIEQKVNRQELSRQLTIRAEVFRDKLLPGQKETWKFSIVKPDGQPADAQLLADMYDASLDKIAPLNWFFNPTFRYDERYYNWESYNNNKLYLSSDWSRYFDCNEKTSTIQFKNFGIIGPIYNRVFELGAVKSAMPMVMKSRSLNSAMMADREESVVESDNIDKESVKQETAVNTTSLQNTEIRTNLQETAFFYPKLLTDSMGHVQFEFTIPQALTQWNLRLLANTSDMLFGQLQKSIVTAKDFMISPNLPRFCRQGDSIAFAAMIYNQTGKEQSGSAILELFNPYTSEIILQRQTEFLIEANSSKAVSFPTYIPKDVDIIGIRIKAGNQHFSDGEQQILAVLPSMTLVTESMPMSIIGEGEKEFQFTSFLDNHSQTKQNYRYTVEYSGNPAWYAVQALPAISPIQFRNASSAINSFYVNTLASFIAQSDKGIKRAIDAWSKSGTDQTNLISKLQKNEELQQILLNESPWVLQAASETENMQALSQLFNTNRLNQIQTEAIDLLKSLQNADGGIAWFANMPSSIYQTLRILESFARLTDLKAYEASEDVRMLQMNALKYADKEIIDRYKTTKKYQNKFIPGYLELYWAFIRSSYQDVPFYNESINIYKQTIEYFATHHKDFNLDETAILSIVLRRYGKAKSADKINQVIRERMTRSEDMGYYWANNRNSYFHSNLSTHVLLMRALYEGGASIEEMNKLKLWLLRQKQTQLWETSQITVDAIYGILLTGTNWLADNTAPIIKIGDVSLQCNGVIGYGEKMFQSQAITPALATITINQKANHPGFGAAYWQYFEQFDAITQHGKDLKIEKRLFKEVQTEAGKAIEPVNGPIHTGDIIVTRLVVTATRDFEFVTLKDQRAACFEPVNQISRYDWSGYYLETKDASTNYFFERLSKGTHVFEYRVRTTQEGLFHDGISSIQCMYAPEYVGNTQGSIVSVTE